ncbi:uncharacterized protein CANTADRAFT_51048 [Suhomyces tanzawaensis NRRL Y-17324]|uniref:Rho-GAP domain-containing protein n=1 Tax=Suhomyces tanzawaensis NRRL Y-17324 TaxID=984487 RepID=A0A1E4SHU2_9ASCO|nr:uncharacterized protein CANTADRAFT_51048 [Suhomyces tanzawaensis NRRL Y-17324]ODV79066.1 hypothetical protein CANTADRAFT_51048 [Suhomyces tanzawaensis NRRL Y-17324]
MRKIWSLRKERDKRKSLSSTQQLYTQSEINQQQNLTQHHNAPHQTAQQIPDYDASNQTITEDFNDDYSTLANSTITSINETSSLLNYPASTRSVSALAKSDYDSKSIKLSWLNVMVNAASADEISERTLKLFRAELKGSHLYLFKPHPNLNIKSFRLTSNSTTSLTSTPTTEFFKHGNSSNITVQDIVSADPLASVDYAITYFDTTVPHPDLSYDFEAHHFTASTASIQLAFSSSAKSNSIESLIHFILFNVDERDNNSVKSIINTMPILPTFGKILKLICSFLTAIFGKKFNGAYNLNVIIERILDLLYNIEENFNGFLLKSDVAPYILRILEIYESEISKILEFKRVMLSKQQGLINLVSNDNLMIADINPIQELSSLVFMNELNLIDFATTISAIDLNFFKKWNSNIDKSLLLYSSINSGLDTSSNPAAVAFDFFYKKNPLIFNNDHHIHYLSRLLINHLFIENSLVNTPSTNSSGLSSSVLERKARLLEKWIDLGCLLDKSGNMSSWLGISSIILSQPVLRLTKIWSLVSPDYIKLLKNDWSPVLFELDRRYLANGSLNSDKLNSATSPNTPNPASNNDEDTSPKDSYHIMAPRGLGKIYPKEKVIPYFGDLLINNSVGSTSNILELESIWKRINYSFNRWNEYLSNLVNYNEIIKYNDDVLRRYDSMGFIFSNESLNQVLYLGVNSDDAKSLPSNYDAESKDSDSSFQEVKENHELRNKLIRLIEVNCDSINLESIMRLSLILEPELPEAYLKCPSAQGPDVSFMRHRNLSSSNISLHSNDSTTSLNAPSISNFNGNDGPSVSDTPASRIPTFNNNYFKINLSKYDELVNVSTNSSSVKDSKLQQLLDPSANKQNLVIDSELTFRVDDFVSGIDMANSTALNALDDVDNDDDEDDVPGLGIDVDDILNSEKFNNFTMSPNPNASNSEVENPATSTAPNVGTKKPNNYSVISSESSNGIGAPQTYRYIPKYASIDKLIDLLLIDSKYFDENVSMDLTEYRFVFLLNYNSFITTKELLDKLAHRFINSGNAVISVMKKLYILRSMDGSNGEPLSYSQPKINMEFPNWSLDTEVDLNELGDVDYELLLKIQINILKVLIVLINNFYSNFSLDLVNKKILIKLLKLFSNEILQWYNSNKIDPTLEKSFESLVNYYKKLKKLFVKKTYRPIEILKFDEYLINEFRFSNSLHEVPMNRNLPGHKNVIKIEKFLLKFNKLLAVFYRGIRAEDWDKVFKILENSFENNALLEFNLQKNSVNDENLLISNIFNYFESLIDPNEKQLVLKKFPLVFRKLFKLYYKFRSYLLIQLTDLNITVDERLDRMKTLLLMVKISKLKMGDNQFVFEGGKDSIPSCIETAVTNVIYSPESRLFTNLWIKASNFLNNEDTSPNTIYDDLNLLLPTNLTLGDLQSSEPLLPCFCWIIENLILINTCPSFYKQTINFNKRYLIFKLIKELSIEDDNSVEAHENNYHETREFDFLLKLDESLINNQNLKEFTLLEKDKTKLFRAVLHDQHKLLILENKKKVIRDAKGSLANSNSGPGPNQSLTKKPSTSSLRRQSLSYKSSSTSRFKISGLFSKSRPFSLNVSGLSNSAAEKIVSSKDLPPVEPYIDPKQKPSLVIPLRNIKLFPAYLLPLCFIIDAENTNVDYFFQAPNESEWNDWLVKLNYANRHWFYSRALNLKANHTFTTFGIPIGVICNREQSIAPRILTIIFEEIEKEGLKDVGIYRISSSISELNNVKSIIDKTGTLNLQEKTYDVHTLTSVVKSYFRELPDALFTDKVIGAFFALKQHNLDEQTEESKIIDQYKETLKMLPLVNFHTLRLLLKHLKKISQYSDVNKMTPSNLATVIGPAFTEASSLDSLINNFGFMNSILEKLINNYEYVFDDEESTVEQLPDPDIMLKEPNYDDSEEDTEK